MLFFHHNYNTSAFSSSSCNQLLKRKDRRIHASPHKAFAMQIESQSLSASSNFTGKRITVYTVMLLCRQGARKNWNQVKLINTSVSGK